jgi:hypothetical protein
VTLGLNIALVLTAGKKVLVDTGMGDKWSEKERAIYRIERSRTLLDSLRALGYGPEDIDVVVNTHLHFDHSGGNTTLKDGKVVPTFPKARYVVQMGEWEDATHPNERNRASYLEPNFVRSRSRASSRPCRARPRSRRACTWCRSAAHTAYHQMVIVEGGPAGAGDPDRSRADHGPPAAAVHHGLRPVPGGHARGQAARAEGRGRSAARRCSSTTTSRRRSEDQAREGPLRARGAARVSREQADVGIIGGSGLYEMEGLHGRARGRASTRRSAAVRQLRGGHARGEARALPARATRRGHKILPHELTSRPTSSRMKRWACERILSVSAVGSLKEQYAPLHM